MNELGPEHWVSMLVWAITVGLVAWAMYRITEEDDE